MLYNARRICCVERGNNPNREKLLEASCMVEEKLPKMTKHEIETLIHRQFLCRIAFQGNAYPHISPFQYIILNGSLYFHFTSYGKKVDLLNQNSPVCVEIEEYRPDFSEYAFVTLQGNLKIVDDPAQRANAIKKFAEEGARRFSQNFLYAHGLPKGAAWQEFSEEKPFLIVKLDPVIASAGLKSR